MTSLEPIKSIIISWVGPFPHDQLNNADEANVLYMIAGKKKYGKKVKVLYIGLTKRTAQQRIREHRNSTEKAIIRWDTTEVWVGHIQHPLPCDAPTLGLAEHYLIHYAQPFFNGKKLARPGPIACLVSQWRQIEGQPYKRKPDVHLWLPDVIWWDKSHWRCGNLTFLRAK